MQMRESNSAFRPAVLEQGRGGKWGGRREGIGPLCARIGTIKTVPVLVRANVQWRSIRNNLARVFCRERDARLTEIELGVFFLCRSSNRIPHALDCRNEEETN